MPSRNESLHTAAEILQRWRKSGQPDVSPAPEEFCPNCRAYLPLDGEGRPEQHRCCVCQDWGRTAAYVPCTACVINPTEDELWRRMGIPLVFLNENIWTYEPLPPRPVLAFVTDWPPDPWMMLLVGGTGTGKTHLAAGILKEAWLLHHVAGRFVRAKALLDRLRATNAEETFELEADVYDDLLSVPLLVLDEVGMGRATEYAQESLYAILEDRWTEERPTVVTMNAPALSRVDPRVRSRLAAGHVLEFRGPDRRAKA